MVILIELLSTKLTKGNMFLFILFIIKLNYGQNLVNNYISCVFKVPIRVKVLMMLWYMASSCTYRELANLFGVSESLASNSVRAIIAVTSDVLLDQFIKWPDAEEAREISRLFEDVHNFPGVIGFIDGTHIPIRKPGERGQDYYNRKDFYSIQLQGF